MGFTTAFAHDPVRVSVKTPLQTPTEQVLGDVEIQSESKPEPKTALEKLYERAPVMKKIAWCESNNRQYDRHGNVLIGFSGADKGLFQINQVHWRKARELGYDLDTRQGNAQFARYLYEREDTDPWYASAHCWRHITLADINHHFDL